MFFVKYKHVNHPQNVSFFISHHILAYSEGRNMMNRTAQRYFMDRLNADSDNRAERQTLREGEDGTISLKSWELLSTMAVSRFIDELDRSSQRDTSHLKRLIRSFLPVVPEEVKPQELPATMDVSWRNPPRTGEYCRVQLPHTFQGRTGDKVWLLYDCEDPAAQTGLLDGKDGKKIDLTKFGVVQCTLTVDKLEQHRRTQLVRVLQFLSFEEFPKYFQCQGDWKEFTQKHGGTITSLQEVDYHRSTTNFHYIGWNYNASNFDFDGSFFVKITKDWYSMFWIPQSACNSDCLAFLASVPREDADAMGLEKESDDD
jgi:hypothetical protein